MIDNVLQHLNCVCLKKKGAMLRSMAGHDKGDMWSKLIACLHDQNKSGFF